MSFVVDCLRKNIVILLIYYSTVYAITLY